MKQPSKQGANCNDMDKTCTPQSMEMPAGVHGLVRQTLAALVRRMASGDMTGVQIPIATPLFCDNGEGSHYHATPELFLQVGGASIMRLTTGRVRNEAGGLLLIPRGVAHQESADSARSPFCNLVFMHEPGRLHYHAGLPSPRKKSPVTGVYVGGICGIPHPHGSRLYGYLNEAADFVMAGHPARHPVVQGLLLTHLGLLQSLVEQGDLHAANTESALVARCRRLVQEQMADTQLSVQQLAGQLRCTPDYLSNRFRRERGVRLTVHINQERCNLAGHLLRTTRWSVKEIALRCGYSDPGYFSRIFSQREGTPPREFRTAEVRRESGGGRK
jgi:AraC-like DNA-binding protein